jgi:hypothetical protein
VVSMHNNQKDYMDEPVCLTSYLNYKTTSQIFTKIWEVCMNFILFKLY